MSNLPPLNQTQALHLIFKSNGWTQPCTACDGAVVLMDYAEGRVIGRLVN